ADLAAIDAGPSLSNNDSAGACNVAWQYVRANTPDLSSGSTIPCSSLPVATSCVNGTFPGNVGGTAPVNVTATNSGRYTIRIRYPVSDADIRDANIAGGT